MSKPSPPLSDTARSLVAPAKGILAADESTGTIEKRLRAIQVASTEDTRRAYRETLFTTPGLGEHISGVILFDETLRQSGSGGTPLVEVLTSQGILTGIKVDRGAKALAGHDGEKVTEGLDGLRERLHEYAGLGARFTKWRAVITLGAGRPSTACLHANAHALARFAALSQEQGLVPIVEPEVLMDGDHTIETCMAATEAALDAVFSQLFLHGIQLDGMLLKPSMVISGKDCAVQADVPTVARETLRCMRDQVPASVPGLVFLSGGQSDILATRHLNEMNRQGGAPWELSFSYGRALQAPALKAWGGKSENQPAAQAALHHRARCNGAARSASYTEAMESGGMPGVGSAQVT